MSAMLKVQELISADKRGILFVCVANSARSQMAEGFARFLAPSAVTIYSAGSAPSTVNVHAIAAMKEVGVNISAQTSKAVDDIPLEKVAVVVTLCKEADCPAVLVDSDVQRIHWPLPDPVRATNEPIVAFREVRDQIRELVSTLF